MNQLTELVRAQYPSYLLRTLLLSLFEVVIVALLFLLTKPYFESYQVFWYLLCLILVPACGCSVAVNSLTKIASQVMVQANKQSITLEPGSEDGKATLAATSAETSAETSAWQYISWKKVVLMVGTGLLIALCYSASAQTFDDLLMLFCALIIATFLFANWIILNAALPFSIAVVSAFRHRRQVYDEAQSVDHIIRFHLLPWSAIAVTTLFTFFVKYYLGLADEQGYVETGAVVKSTYICGAVVAIWLWLEVGQIARLEHILGHINLTGIGHISDSEAFSLVMAVPLVLAVIVAAINGFFDIEHYRYQTAIAVSMLFMLLAAFAGVSIAIFKLCASKALSDPQFENT
ncbi:hypothetical protein [Pseudoalteromonas sp. S16_S37]|uniref:hypothetical protein n=1 Tax=Pseudoalteromonas sp. S16_S37 TaxID=2720228 RepID=UPI001680D60F|nr:hypothetical protein [Pseudoalteromonas sp. S16_S37]MBD1580785.1 hypothetical protein [Pseudoalteromonas sp. S16_S37]